MCVCAAQICFKIVNKVVSEDAFLVRAHTFKFAKNTRKEEQEIKLHSTIKYILKINEYNNCAYVLIFRERKVASLVLISDAR